jgi:hypothetical protein
MRVNHPYTLRRRILGAFGKRVSEADKRRAVVALLDYAEAFNCEVYDLCGFRPFGPLRGFKGAVASLDKRTSRWILAGIGFFKKSNASPE